ncbi:hypothetical protein Anapl_08600 [Anas platyrhynchos]|uniref:Uncharacterized protein n=1 Tax=Anas platyrhynchos TaxID=8839 RepID=R0LW52_ANAPL|nr:hypothetical protein Anapl_08600 [Anas platyrhynchos]
MGLRRRKSTLPGVCGSHGGASWCRLVRVPWWGLVGAGFEPGEMLRVAAWLQPVRKVLADTFQVEGKHSVEAVGVIEQWEEVIEEL